MEKDARILITGNRGFVGRNLWDYLYVQGVKPFPAGTFDLTERGLVDALFSAVRPDYVFHCAGFVRGIAGNMANQEKAYRINALINTNVVAACLDHKVKKIVALGTVAMYPHGLEGQFKEDLLHFGRLHAAEYGYAAAKRGMLTHLEVSGLDWAMPICTNMYGPHDRFDSEHGHVIPALVRKFHEGNPIIWGDGAQTRDFLYVHDAVRALVLLMAAGQGAINLATGAAHKLSTVAEELSRLSGRSYSYDATKPVGQRSRSYDIAQLTALGFAPEYSLTQGLQDTYAWYIANHLNARK